jgi:hypothetical protein
MLLNAIASLIVLVITIVDGSTIDNNFQWKSCPSLTPWPVTVLNITISPSPFVPGDNVTIGSKLEIPTPINGGNWILEVTKFSIVFQKETGQNCDSCHCPCAGIQELDLVIPVASYAPHGPYGGSFKVFDTDNTVETCVKFTFDL